MSKLVLVIGNKNYSSWSMRPWVLCQYFKIPVQEVLIPLFQPGSKEEILKYSPSGKVPFLRDGKVGVWESLAICEYLAEKFPKKNLWPKDRAARAAARAVSSEMHAGFPNLRKTCPMNVRANKPLAEISAEVEKDVVRIQALWEDCRKKFGKGGEFLFGKFSIADAMFALVVWRFRTYGIKCAGHSEKYCKAMLALAVMKEWEKAAIAEPYVIEHH